MKDFSVRIEGFHEDLEQIEQAVRSFVEGLEMQGIRLEHVSFGSGHLLGGSKDLTVKSEPEVPSEEPFV